LKEEQPSDWAREYKIGVAFSKEGDLYRAITAYKRALFLLPSHLKERREQIEYDLILAYYLGGKQQEALNVFENSPLQQATPLFPPFDELLLILYDCYRSTHQEGKAEQILALIGKQDTERQIRLKIYEEVKRGDLETIDETVFEDNDCGPHGPFTPDLLLLREQVATTRTLFLTERKSIQRARTLNAILPGAGYYYVGQKQTAITSFLLNTLFIAASYQCFHHHQVAAGLLLGSLEFGWYFGGIHGAGLAAEEYNQRLYEAKAFPLLIQGKCFPLLLFEKSF
jgi:hypothetical protein